MSPSAADAFPPIGSPCTCGHPMGTGACLAYHAARLALLPRARPVHVHVWLPEVRGLSYCRDTSCDATRRRADEW